MATNLQFIKSASGTDVTALDITNCFSSSYDVYQLEITEYINSDLSNYFWGRYLDSSGTVIDQTEYDRAHANLRSYTSFGELRFENDSAFILGYGQSDTKSSTGNTTTIYNPFDSSSFTFATIQASTFVNGFGGAGLKGIAVHKNAEQLSGIRIFAQGSDSMNSIKATMYGIK
jgi:hypothetical protein